MQENFEQWILIATTWMNDHGILPYVGPATAFLIFLLVWLRYSSEKASPPAIPSEVNEREDLPVPTQEIPREQVDLAKAPPVPLPVPKQSESKDLAKELPVTVLVPKPSESKVAKAPPVPAPVPKQSESKDLAKELPVTVLVTKPSESKDLAKELPVPAPVIPKPRDLPQEIEEIRQANWRERLRKGLEKTKLSFIGGMQALFQGKTALDGKVLEELHELLFRADLGVETVDKLVAVLETKFKNHPNPSWDEIKQALTDPILEMLEPRTPNASPQPENLKVILVVGVNGVGKTTTIGKIAANYLAQDKSVLLCAADTFRAAAIDQLKVWGDRLHCEVVAHQEGSDPAAVAFDSMKKALAKKTDILIIDTAGRLHNKKPLMDELHKIKRIVSKDLQGAPHETLLVVDATTGQNAFSQVKAFKEVVDITGLVVTKLDGTAKGGVIIGISHQFGLPIRYIGVGEKAADLREFHPKDYVDSLFGS